MSRIDNVFLAYIKLLNHKTIATHTNNRVFFIRKVCMKKTGIDIITRGYYYGAKH